MFEIAHGPRRIVCLTEETTEWLYLLGEEARIVGISGYTVRPRRVREEKPKVSAFLNAKIDRILDLRPDCVFGFSDLQADIAAGSNWGQIPISSRREAPAPRPVHGPTKLESDPNYFVTVFNQRSVEEIFSMMYQVAAMVGQGERALLLMSRMRERLEAIAEAGRALARRPKVFFEEWDEPHISAIRWVSELLTIAGGDDCFPELATQPLGRDRIIPDGAEIARRNPDIVIGSWCGKKFRPEKVAARPGWENVAAVRNGQLFEIKSADILQPGPAALTDGAEQLHRIMLRWSANHA